MHDINIDMKSGDFLAVVGQVGCGKTSLLYSIMEETGVMKGKSSIAGSIAYVEQEPFIFSSSVKDNITFGKPFEQERIEKAIKAAQLEKDIEIFTNGVDTVIGERGVNISGG